MRRFVLIVLLVFCFSGTIYALPVVPQPREVKEMTGYVSLIKTQQVRYSPANNPQAKSCAVELAESIKRSTGKPIPVIAGSGPDYALTVSVGNRLTPVPDAPSHNEGCALSISNGIYVRSSGPTGLYYAVQTIKQLITSYGSKLPSCIIKDWPAVGHRAVMIDMARLTEKHEYYYELIDFLAQRKINTVYLHFSDDGACCLEYKSRPEITTRYAFSQEEIKDLIKYAADRHVELIPEVESWGHARYILQHEQYSGIRESSGTLCTLKPGTWEVLDDLYRETAQLFPSKYMHIGCDEADFGKCSDCTAYIEKNGKDALVGYHLAKACGLAKKHGKTPVLWGDVLLRFRQAADLLPKDAIISYWNYKAKVGSEPAVFLKSKGFTVIGCPALVWGGRMVLPHGDSLENIKSFSNVISDEKLMGISTTVWVPQRYINDSLWYGLAYAAQTAWTGSNVDDNAFSKAFLKEYYGIDATSELVEQVKTAHYLGLGNSSLFTNLWNYRGQFEKLSKADLLKYTIRHRDAARPCLLVLRRFEPAVKRHKDEYAAFRTAVEVIEFAAERAASAGDIRILLMKAQNGDRKSLQRLITLLENQIERHDQINSELLRFWDRRRYPDDPQKFGEGNNVLGTFNSSAIYIKAINARLKEIAEGRSSDWEGVLVQPKMD